MKLLSTVSILALLSASPVDAQDKTWSGPFLGANVGYSWGSADVKDTDGGVAPGPFSYAPSGFVGGAQAGYNFQFDRIVVGLEGDVGYLDLNGSSKLPSSDPNYHQDITLGGGVYGDITGRIGVLVTPVSLLYVKGGYALFDGEALQATTKSYYDKTGTDTFSGFVIGGGLEQKLTDSLSLKIEFQHFDFGSEGGHQTKARDGGETDDGTPIGSMFHNTTDLTAETIKVGLNYKF